jgi:diguanylate cyclase (GGDEF)-like protein/PAS domain S-box-containing protein
MNPAARRAQGLAPDAPIWHLNALSLNPPQTVARHAVEIVPAAIEKGLWLGETLQWDAQHREIVVSHLLIAHKDAQGRVEYFSAVLRDITAQKTAEHDLHRSEAVLRSVADLVPVAIVVVDKDLRCQFVNQGFEMWTGRPRDEVLGRTAEEVLGPEEYAHRRPWIERAMAGERVRFEREYPEREHHRHVQIDYIPLFAGDGSVEGFVAVTADLSSHRAEQQRLQDLADTDALTQLLNRAGFERALDERAARAAEVGQGELVAVLYIDLDEFKPINDRHGHAVGDQLLQLFAQRLRAVVRPSDTIARVGGDEFVIVLDGLHEEANAMRVAEQVVAVADSSFELPDLPPLRIGASVGVAFWRPGQAGWAEALDRADAMLYRAKAQGRGRAVTTH